VSFLLSKVNMYVCMYVCVCKLGADSDDLHAEQN